MQNKKLSLPAGLFLAAAPAEPVAVKQLKAQAQVGDEVIMRVVVGGEVNVFVPSRAIVKVIDTEMENLCLGPGDSCKTPWDYCCATADDLQGSDKKNLVVNAQGIYVEN